MSMHRMTAAQAADALGVRPATIYAYVSRGVLQRTSVVDSSGQRISLFEREEVLALAARRSRPRAGVVASLIESDVTTLDPRGRLSFRGWDVAELVGMGFERAVAVLWAVDRVGLDTPPPSGSGGSTNGGGSGGSAGGRPVDRVLLALVLAAGRDPGRDDLAPAHVHEVGWSAIAAAVSALGGRADVPVAEALTTVFVGGTPDNASVRAVDAALVALMDHELAASTLAARVAASTGADPWMSLVAGVAALSGPLHGAAARAALVQLRRWLADRSVGEGMPAGFGHKVYDGPDPRFAILLDHVAGLDPDLADAVDSLAVEVARERSVLPNVDLGLAALAVAGGLPDEAPETIFIVSRLAGFTAHLVEEYGHGLRFRPRAVTSR